jgi:2-oxoglutarate ferredoxin oxidoreductase subunit alpha
MLHPRIFGDKMSRFDYVISIGGAAGQGIATPGNILARLFARQGIHMYAYNAYQSIIRGGHSFLTVRCSEQQVRTHGDVIDLLICLNQDTMDRHLEHMREGTSVIYNSNSINPGEPVDGVQLCPMDVGELAGKGANKLMQNTVAIAVACQLLGIEFSALEDVINFQFSGKNEVMVADNVRVAKAAYDHSAATFQPASQQMPTGGDPLAVWRGNEAFAMAAAGAGVKFYCAYPMSPSTGILHWMAENARELDIMVRQVEDEISVICMAIGAAHAGCRSMCATSGGGFALMTEAIGEAGMMEVPVVVVDVQRAGPSTGVPTKTEQGDLWQALGASQGDFPKLILAPSSPLDGFQTIPEVFNLADKYQLPAIILSDLLISDETSTIDPNLLDMHPTIDRGELITEAGEEAGSYERYKFTESGISPRALPGIPGYEHVVSSDEHMPSGILISDEFTHPHKRRAMMEKRQRKMDGLLAELPPPAIIGDSDAEVTLVGWGSTADVIQESIEQLAAVGVVVNHLHFKWMVPFHADEATELLSSCKRTIIVENNYTGLFHRYLRSETGFTVDGHIRKYDGEPFKPHHITAAVQDQLAGGEAISVPYEEIIV